MNKLAVLRLDGNLDRGVKVTLEIGPDGDRPKAENCGYLPPAPDMVTQYRHWLSTYRSLGVGTRIKPQGIDYGGSINDLLEECLKSATELGDRLNTWLKSSEFLTVREKLLEQLAPADTTRILIKANDIKLHQLPWHSWDVLERFTKAEIALSPLENQEPPPAPRGKKVKILAILGNSEGINIEKDRALLEELPQADITFLVEPSREEVNDKLWEQPWNILFFAGHSQTVGEKGRIYINQTDSLTIKELRKGLQKAIERGLSLAIFNSCDGLGLARELADCQMPQIIVMREPVPDKVAQEFLKFFLQGFSKGVPLYLAVRDARERLEKLEGEFPKASWLPVICQNPAATPPTWQDLCNPFPNLPAIRSRLIAAGFLGASIILASMLSGPLAVACSKWALQKHEAKQLASAELMYQWSLRLDFLGLGGVEPRTYYNLGILYEELYDWEKARDAYEQAIQRGMAEAYNNLSRLDIKEGNYENAVDRLLRGLQLARADEVKYSLHKNMGWARLKQGRYEDATAHLQEAIKLDNSQTKAAAHCLLAQVWEHTGREEASLIEWEYCLGDASSHRTPEEDEWIAMARERILSRVKQP